MNTRGLGRGGEDLAARYLEERGYRVEARNFGTQNGEIDIVASNGDTLCFVEVRMRSSAQHGGPMETVNHAKQRRVVRAALVFLQHYAPGDKMVRFDVISIVGRGSNASIEHIPDAFDAGM